MAEEKVVCKSTFRYSALKIAGIGLTSFGVVNPQGPQFEEIRKTNKEKNVYKKTVLEQGRIFGAIFLGDRRSIPENLKLMDQNTDVAKYKDLLLEDSFDSKQIDFWQKLLFPICFANFQNYLSTGSGEWITM